MTYNATSLEDYETTAPGAMVKIANTNFVPLQEYLQLSVEQDDAIKHVSLKTFAHVPFFGRTQFPLGGRMPVGSLLSTTPSCTSQRKVKARRSVVPAAKALP